MQLLLLRHGQSIANAEGRIQGHFDTSLSDLGRHQTECLADRLASVPIDAVYSSPLKRARETADLLAERLRLPVEEVFDLRERGAGELTGMNRDEIRRRFGDFTHAGVNIVALLTAGAELKPTFAARVTAALRRIVVAQEDRTAAVVAHGGVIQVACRWGLNAPGARFAIGNASVTILQIDRIDDSDGPPRVKLVALNDRCHLAGVAPVATARATS